MNRIIILFSLMILLSCFDKKGKTWVAIGDSITYLNEHKDETGNRITKGYMTRVEEKLHNIHYFNQGHNGWTAVQIATEIEHLGLVKADLYTVFLGTNDWWAGKPLGTLDDYKNNTGNATVNGAFRTIINKLRSLNENAKIVLITPMQRGDFVQVGNLLNNAYGSYKEKNGQSLEQFADVVKVIGEYEHLSLVDLYHNPDLAIQHLVKYKRLKNPQTGIYQNYYYPAYTEIPFNPNVDEYPYPLDAIDMTYDGLHPSDKGFALIADLLVKVFKEQ